MKQRTKSYLGTFVNSPEGLSSYRLMIKHIRQVVTGGRFVKMFRGNPQYDLGTDWSTGKPCKLYQATQKNQGSTHFDVYLLPREHNFPKFYNFELK